MLEVEATGKNIEQAIENALFELKAIREDVDIKIIEQGGLLKKAKVLVSISEDEQEKYIQKEKKRNEKLFEEEIKEEKLEKTEDKIVEIKDDKDEVEVLKTEKVENKTSDLEKTKMFINGVLNKVSLTADATFEENKNEVFVKIDGAGDIIGYRGEGLNALQYLTSVYVSKNNRHSKKVRVDCDNYRQRREESLIALAKRLEAKVLKTGASIKLEPMNANERRIIHSALTESDVETFSKGEEPHRYLTICLKK